MGQWQIKCDSCGDIVVGVEENVPCPIKPGSGQTWTCEKCTAREERIARLERRITILEMQIEGVLEREQMR